MSLSFNCRKNKMEYEKTIILSKQDLQEANEIALKRMEGVREMGLRDKHGAESDRNFKYHLLGARGEIAFRKFIGSQDKITVNTFKSIPDISGFEVRTRSNEDFDLIIRKDDPDDRIYVLVTGEGCQFKIVGWLKGQEKYNFDYKTFNSRPKAWFIPKEKLHKISELVEKRI